MDWSEEYEVICDVIQGGGVVLFPTDTVWCLGCDVFNQAAVERIYNIKKRRTTYPLVVLASNIDMLAQYIPSIPPRLEKLLEVHERPLTVLYQEVIGIPEYIKSKDGSVAIRITNEPYSFGLVKSFGRLMVATAAHISGSPIPTSFGEIQSDILQNVDYIATYNRDAKEAQQPSVMVRYDPMGELEFVRR